MSENPFIASFQDAAKIADYAAGPPRFAPGFDAMHRMTAILLAERAGPTAHVLVLGAGGGLELTALAQAQPGWRFTGVDPSGPMLDLARRAMGTDADRAELVEGLIDAAPAGPFDAATCLLTLHFLQQAERTETLRQMHDRMKPGAPLVVVHASFPQAEPARSRWLDRYAAYAIASGVDPAMAEQGRKTVSNTLPAMEPADDEACLRDAGFHGVEQFYAAFTWRGWVAFA